MYVIVGGKPIINQSNKKSFQLRKKATEAALLQKEVPTLEKLLVDTQKDADFDYLRGVESLNMYWLAFDQYSINTQKLLRYAKR